jgi:hypothetical protein
MSDRELWLIIRRALLMIVKAIERKYSITEEIKPTKSQSISWWVDQ